MRRRNKARNRFREVIMGIRTLLPAMFLAGMVCGCHTNPATGRSMLLLVSPRQVAAMGDAAAGELTEKYGGNVASPQLQAYVEGVGRAVAARTEEPFSWSFTVLDSDVINAFALPGRRVYVNRGLLARCTNEAQVAGILGHEIGHVMAQHVDERLSQILAAELGLGLLSSAVDSSEAMIVARLVSQGTLLKFSRDQEREADVLGVRYMTAAGYNPRAMIEVLEILSRAGAGSRQVEFLSTHPHPQTRMRVLEDLLNGPYRHTDDNPDFGAYSERFRQQAEPYLRSEQP